MVQMLLKVNAIFFLICRFAEEENIQFSSQLILNADVLGHQSSAEHLLLKKNCFQTVNSYSG